MSLAQISNLTSTLDRLQRRRGIRSTTRRLGIYIDEYGYQTRPPDPIGGIKPNTQDVWLQRAAYMAWRHAAREAVHPVPVARRAAQRRQLQRLAVGLRFTNGRAKPSLAHFDTPFALDARRNRLWGQVRPGGRHTVTVERRRFGAGAGATARGRAHRFPRVLDAEASRLSVATPYRYRADGRLSARRSIHETGRSGETARRCIVPNDVVAHRR